MCTDSLALDTREPSFAIAVANTARRNRMTAEAKLRHSTDRRGDMGPFLRVGGTWDIVQKNGFRVTVTINQNNTNGAFTASAVSSTGVQSNSASGSVNGPNFNMTINWSDGHGGAGARGHYTGMFSHGPFTQPPIGFLQGETQDLDVPASHAHWESEGKNFQIE
jgi:hypothetical protein